MGSLNINEKIATIKSLPSNKGLDIHILHRFNWGHDKALAKVASSMHTIRKNY